MDCRLGSWWDADCRRSFGRSTELEVRVVPGPQDDHFRTEALEILGSAMYTVSSKSDRMGYRLEGPALPHLHRADIISDGMSPGGIQVPPDGKPIVTALTWIQPGVIIDLY